MDKTSNANSRVGNRKLGLSCAECRRSKLRCDRIFPCQACTRRGCAAICPNGTTAPTKGNKVLLNQNQSLSDEAKAMEKQIKELESSLRRVHAERSSSPHPLLPHDTGSESSDEPKEDVLDDNTTATGVAGQSSAALGSLSLGGQGHGEPACAEINRGFVLNHEPLAFQTPGLPWQIMQLADSYPFGTTVRNEVTLDSFRQFLPPKDVALKYANLYHDYSACLILVVTREDFMNNIFNVIYDEQSGGPLWDKLHCCQVSVFFQIMCIAAWNDNRVATATRFYMLAHAVFSLVPIWKEASSATVSALVLGVYHSSQIIGTNSEERWILLGLAGRIAHSLGLQRNSSGWKLSPEETQRRRTTFWELFTYDAFLAFYFGRPPSMNINHTDCPFPKDTQAVVKPNGETEPNFYTWKYGFSVECLSPSLQHVVGARTTDYASILKLDRRVRKFAVPPRLRPPNYRDDQPTAKRAWPKCPKLAMQQYAVLCIRESNLMYIHRSYFAQALQSDPHNVLKHKYGDSVLAVYRSASGLITGMRGLFDKHPAAASLGWFFWSCFSSACVILARLVMESPGCKLSANAVVELEQALTLYQIGPAKFNLNSSTWETLLKLTERARRAYDEFHSGISSNALRRPSPLVDSNQLPDNFKVFLAGAPAVINSRRDPRDTSPPALSGGIPETAQLTPPSDAWVSSLPSFTHGDRSIISPPYQSSQGSDSQYAASASTSSPASVGGSYSLESGPPPPHGAYETYGEHPYATIGPNPVYVDAGVTYPAPFAGQTTQHVIWEPFLGDNGAT